MTIFFYKRSEKPYGVFSNFSHHGFELDGKTWPTCEHFYQAMKFDDDEVAERIRTTKSPMDVAVIGRSTSLPLRADWDSVKVDVMRRGLIAKFSQNDDVRQVLLSTGQDDIVEQTNVDHYWGCGTRGDGLNMLGKLLVEVREELRKSESNPGPRNFE